MSIKRPGGLGLTKEAVEQCGFSPKAALLDIGCGHGDAAGYLAKEFGYKLTGIDMNADFIAQAKEKYSEPDFQLGDGEFLENFSSLTFDGVLMECVLSIINLPDEAIHEAYCVLKKGGKLIISDLYHKNPDAGMLRALEIEADRAASKPHTEGSCSDDCNEEHKKRPVKFRNGAYFLKEPLIQCLTETGFKVVQWQDKSKELEEFIGEKILAGESAADCFCASWDNITKKKDIGYFFLIAEKPL